MSLPCSMFVSTRVDTPGKGYFFLERTQEGALRFVEESVAPSPGVYKLPGMFIDTKNGRIFSQEQGDGYVLVKDDLSLVELDKKEFEDFMSI